MSIFDKRNEVKSNWVKWGKEGDYIAGILVSKRIAKNQLKDGAPDQTIYELKASDGEYHDIDEKKKVVEKATEVRPGEYWLVGGKPGIDAQMRNVKLGEIVGLKFIEEVASKTKGYNATKIIKVYTAHEVDPEFMAGVGEETKDDGFQGM